MRLCLLVCLLLCLLPAPLRADAVSEAERAFSRGQDERALKLLARPIKQRVARALAVRGRILKSQGKSDDAEQALYQLIDLYNAGKIKKSDGPGLWAVAEAAQLLGAFSNANEAFALATQASPRLPEIEVAWAALYLQKHDLRGAHDCLARALAVQPDHPRALERMARVKLEQGASFAEVEALLDRALAKEPQLSAAFTTRAGIRVRDEELSQADVALDRALAINPHDTEALSVRAAVRFVAGDNAGFERAVAAVLAINPRFSGLYSIVARYAEWEHRYAELVTLADAALRLDPDDADAHATRGLNLLRIGKELEGRAALKQSWQRDHYNLLVYNTLDLYEQVIDPLYESSASPPFVVRMLKEERPALEPYLMPLLHEAYESMATRYGIRPEGPLFIELYATERDFAVRTSGLPRLGVQGVCFGNTLTALSPRASEINWGQIVWHELSHVFHVALAKGRVPRWFTEGLSEHETERARPEWRREDDRPLWDALQAGRFPALAQLNHAFTHARSNEAITVAYYGSARVLDYLATRFGYPAIASMLRGWGEGLSSEQVFERALQSDMASIDCDFRAAELARLQKKYAHDFRVDVADFEQLPTLRAAATDGAGRAALSLGLATVGDPDEARTLAEQVLREAPDQPLALFALSHLALKQGDLPAAIATLQRLLASGVDGYQLRMLLARSLRKRGAAEAALPQLEAALRIDPERHEAYAMMADLADTAGDSARLTRALERWSFLDQHARAPLRRYLALLEQRGDYASLLTRCKAALYLDPEHSDLHRRYALALQAHGDLPQARKEGERALSLAQNPQERSRAQATLRQLGAKPTRQTQAPVRDSR